MIDAGAMADYPGNGLVDQFDPLFAVRGGSTEFTDTLSFPVAQGDKIPISYYSSLATSPTPDDVVVGATTNNAYFGWTLNVTIAPSP